MYVHGGHIMTQLWTGHRYYLLCIPYSMLRKLPASLHVLGKTEERNMCFEFSEPLKWRANWSREARYWENREEMRAWLRFRCVWRPRVILLFGKQYVPKLPSPLVYFTDAKTVLTRIIHHLFEIFHCWTVYSSWKMLGNVIMLCRYAVKQSAWLWGQWAMDEKLRHIKLHSHYFFFLLQYKHWHTRFVVKCTVIWGHMHDSWTSMLLSHRSILLLSIWNRKGWNLYSFSCLTDDNKALNCKWTV